MNNKFIFLFLSITFISIAPAVLYVGDILIDKDKMYFENGSSFSCRVSKTNPVYVLKSKGWYVEGDYFTNGTFSYHISMCHLIK